MQQLIYFEFKLPDWLQTYAFEKIPIPMQPFGWGSLRARFSSRPIQPLGQLSWDISSTASSWRQESQRNHDDTVDGRNPAPPGMVKTL